MITHVYGGHIGAAVAFTLEDHVLMQRQLVYEDSEIDVLVLVAVLTDVLVLVAVLTDVLVIVPVIVAVLTDLIVDMLVLDVVDVVVLDVVVEARLRL